MSEPTAFEKWCNEELGINGEDAHNFDLCWNAALDEAARRLRAGCAIVEIARIKTG